MRLRHLLRLDPLIKILGPYRAKRSRRIAQAYIMRQGIFGDGSGLIIVKQRPIFSTQQRPKLSSSRARFRLFFPLLEPEGIIPGFQDVAVMGDAIE